MIQKRIRILHIYLWVFFGSGIDWFCTGKYKHLISFLCFYDPSYELLFGESSVTFFHQTNTLESTLKEETTFGQNRHFYVRNWPKFEFASIWIISEQMNWNVRVHSLLRDVWYDDDDRTLIKIESLLFKLVIRSKIKCTGNFYMYVFGDNFLGKVS